VQRDATVREGDIITLDGTTGEVMLGQLPMRRPNLSGGELAQFMTWVDSTRQMEVRSSCCSCCVGCLCKLGLC
jgi:pyruvate,orthophosphate dikinase